MKLLFLAYLENDAVVRCVHRLQGELAVLGIQSDLFTFRWERSLPLEEKTEWGMRYRADTWYRHAQVKRDANGKLSMTWYEYLRVAVYRGFSMLVGGKAYQEQGLPMRAGRKLGGTLCTLCKTNGYDWIVSVSYPFVMHRLAQRYRDKGMNWAMYALDPFYNNATYSSARKRRRLALERSVSEDADCIFHVPEQQADYRCSELLSLKSKYHSLPYPNFQKPVTSTESSPLRIEPNTVNVVYVGTLYAEIRKPDALLALFEKMHASHSELRLHLIGQVFGLGAEQTISRYKSLLGDALQTYLPVSETQAYAALQAADVLVNLGNTIQNQMPSKLWECIATGKPILNICMTRDCNTLPYLSVYPCAMSIDESMVDQERIVENALDFVRKDYRQAIPWETLSRIYANHLGKAVAMNFLEALKCERRKADDRNGSSRSY